MSISAVILAGGKSSRMGRDKALLPFANYSTLSEYQYRRLEKIFNRVYLSSKVDKFPFDAKIIFDKYEEYNPLNAIISSFEEINSEAIFFISVDMPFLSLLSIEKMIEIYRDSSYDIVATRGSVGLEPMGSIYSKDIYKIATKMYSKNNFKLKNLILNSNSYDFCVEDKELLNINKEKDYNKALEINLL